MNTEARNILTDAMQELVHSISNLTEEELNTVPAFGGWTIAQVGDHLLKSYGVVKILKEEGIKTSRDPAEKVQIIKEEFLFNTNKTTAPLEIHPSAGVISKKQLLEGIRHKILEFCELIDQNDLRKIVTGFKLPVLGTLTRLEWIYFTSYHTQRHLKQIEKIANNIGQLRKV